MSIKIMINGGLTLFGAVMMIISFLGDKNEGEGSYGLMFWLGVFFFICGFVLLWRSGTGD